MTEQQQDKKLREATEVLITSDSLKQAVHKIINPDTKNKREGFGIMTFNDAGMYQQNSRYEGSWKNDRANGAGFFSYVDGQTYTGNFVNGIMTGQGVMVYPDGRRYEGEFLNNQRNGYGVMVYQDGAKYQEGSRYEGEWLNDMRHGNGEMIYLNDGRRLIGLFKENAFVGS